MADSRNDVPVSLRGKEITENDWRTMADFISDETTRRAAKRSKNLLDAQWREVDRQIRMEPKPKVGADGKVISGTEWMPNIELPLQAETLELLSADARQLIFSTDREWFSAHVGLTDKYLASVDFKSLLLGDDNDVPSTVNQENADAMLEGTLSHHHSLYDFRDAWDLLNGEAFKYGTFAARVKMVRRSHFPHGKRGVFKKEVKIPVIVPQSIKNTYLDDTPIAIMREGHMVSPSHIFSYWQDLDDLRLAAKKGGTDPEKDGGWMPDRLKDVESPDLKRSNIQILELQGDLIVPRSSGPALFLPNCIVSVVVGKKDPTVFRFRWLEFDFNDYIIQDYHRDDVDSPYGVSPLMKGAPLQRMATEAYSRMAQASALNTDPPIRWNPQDQYLMASGGPVVAPGESWPALGDVTPQIIGDPVAMLAIFQVARQMYADETGVSAPRLGAQTKSHQTAFAIGTEQSRGAVRTVDYVRSVMYGAMNTFLNIETKMLRKTMAEQPVYIPKWQAWAEFGKSELPEFYTFDVHGSGGPSEDAAIEAKRAAALQQALQVEIARRQVGEQGLDLQKIQETILREGGFIDIDQFFAQSPVTAPTGIADGQGIPGSPQLVEGPAQAAFN